MALAFTRATFLAVAISSGLCNQDNHNCECVIHLTTLLRKITRQILCSVKCSKSVIYYLEIFCSQSLEREESPKSISLFEENKKERVFLSYDQVYGRTNVISPHFIVAKIKPEHCEYQSIEDIDKFNNSRE